MLPCIITAFLVTLFCLLSTAMMSYIALATPIGPWIAPMLTLLATIICSLLPDAYRKNSIIYYSVAGGSVGGILSIALCSSLPTWYFLDSNSFNELLAQPYSFVASVGLISLSAGLYGFMLATLFEQRLIYQQKLAFPIGTLVFSIVSSVHSQSKKIIQLLAGFFSTLLFGLLQQTTMLWHAVIPQEVILCKTLKTTFLTIPALSLRLDTLPMLWAIGFIAGMPIAIPLACGVLSKIMIVDPAHKLLFPVLNATDFSIAFCSGLITISSLLGFLKLPALLKKNYQTMHYSTNTLSAMIFSFKDNHLLTAVGMVTALSLGTFFIFFKFSVLYAFYLLGGTAITTYIMATIAGKIGLAQLGRFATFVMVPGMLLFGINPVSTTLVATFVEITGGVATDILFGRKLGALAQLNHRQLMAWQLLGLMLSSCLAGIVVWFLCMHFGLGSVTLFAQRAQARALLINVRSFNFYALLLGALYGFVLKQCNLNPLLVFGGILMPLNYCLGLILGGLSTLLLKNREHWEPLCSGIFTANSLTELLKIII